MDGSKSTYKGFILISGVILKKKASFFWAGDLKVTVRQGFFMDV